MPGILRLDAESISFLISWLRRMLILEKNLSEVKRVNSFIFDGLIGCFPSGTFGDDARGVDGPEVVLALFGGCTIKEDLEPEPLEVAATASQCAVDASE